MQQRHWCDIGIPGDVLFEYVLFTVNVQRTLPSWLFDVTALPLRTTWNSSREKKKGKHCNQCFTKKQPKYWEIWNTFLHSIHLTNNHEDPTPAKIAFCRLSGWVKWRQRLLSRRTVTWFLLKYLPIVTQVLELKYSNNYLAYLNSQNSILTSFF